MFDVVAVIVSEEAIGDPSREARAVNWLRDAFGHLKVIGHDSVAAPLLEKAGVESDEGVIAVKGANSVRTFVATAKAGRRWERESALRSIG